MRRIFFVLALLLFSDLSLAQSYPNHAVKVIVPWPPGQATDIAARMLAEKMQDALKQPFVVDNRAGAGGSIGTEIALKSPADGYTVLAASSGPVSIMPSLQKIPYEPLKDLQLIGLVSRNPYALVVNANFPAKDAKEFVALVKASPDKYTFASSGTGATAHLVAELFNSQAGLKARHVPYKGSAPAITDVIGGQVDYMVETVASVAPHIKSGKLKTFGVSTAKRAAALPDVPTLAESAGLPDYDIGAWIGYGVPVGTPREVVQRLAGEMQKALAAPDLRERLFNAGLDPADVPFDQLPAFLRREQERYAAIIKGANIKVE
jgi:tripartite-type tricarboxylate transporter receptor subunit TctC